MSLRDDLVRLFPDLARMPPGAFVVGGAVRDLLLGRTPADVDVASVDPLACARSVGRPIIRLGRDHLSAWRVVGGKHVYDFAEMLDHDIERDLARRDFTVNAMAVDLLTGELLDPHRGRADLDARVVRMVNEANFDDDPLRMLKAVRMAITLGFSLDDVTRAAIARRAAAIESTAPERVTYELSVTFSTGELRRAVSLLRETALDVPLFGRAFDAADFHADGVSVAGAFALIVHDPRAQAARWRWSGTLLRDVLLLQNLLRYDAEDLRIPLYDAGERVARQLPPLLRAIGRDDRVDQPNFSVAPLLNGEDIARLTSLPPGPELGALMRALLEAQIRGEVRTRAEAEKLVRSSDGLSGGRKAGDQG